MFEGTYEWTVTVTEYVYKMIEREAARQDVPLAKVLAEAMGNWVQTLDAMETPGGDTIESLRKERDEYLLEVEELKRRLDEEAYYRSGF